MTDVTRSLARYVVSVAPNEIPDAVRHEARRSLLHWLGCSIGGSKAAAMDRALAALDQFSGPRMASVLGRSERVDPLLASLINGISADALSFSDTHLKTVVHPGGLVGPAVLALAERTKISGAEFLHAFLLGMEVACRVGLTVYPWHYHRGWHISATVGVFGAAAGAGRLLRLDAQQMTWALGLAATQGAGLRNMFGSMGKNFHGGRAAQGGLTAAFLASENFTSSDDAIEGRRGFVEVFGESPVLAAATADIGHRFEISENTYKPFPCGVVMSPAIDGCLSLRSKFNPPIDDIAAVELKVNPLVLELTNNRRPASVFQAKLSVTHAAAAALVHGRVTEHEFSEAVFTNPAVVALRGRMQAVASPAIREDEAEVVATLRGGKVLRYHVEHAVGSAARPMSDRDIEVKFHGMTEAILPQWQRDALIDLCWNIAGADDAGLLARLSAPQTEPVSRASNTGVRNG